MNNDIVVLKTLFPYITCDEEAKDILRGSAPSRHKARFRQEFERLATTGSLRERTSLYRLKETYGALPQDVMFSAPEERSFDPFFRDMLYLGFRSSTRHLPIEDTSNPYSRHDSGRTYDRYGRNRRRKPCGGGAWKSLRIGIR